MIPIQHQHATTDRRRSESPLIAAGTAFVSVLLFALQPLSHWFLIAALASSAVAAFALLTPSGADVEPTRASARPRRR